MTDEGADTLAGVVVRDKLCPLAHDAVLDKFLHFGGIPLQKRGQKHLDEAPPVLAVATKMAVRIGAQRQGFDGQRKQMDGSGASVHFGVLCAGWLLTFLISDLRTP
jgi:hypothetical protein